MTVKLPQFHLPGSVSNFFRNITKFSKRALEEYKFLTCTIRMGVMQQFIDRMALALTQIIHFSGKAPDAKRRLGNDWEKRVRKAVWHDHLAAVNFAIQTTEYPGGKYFWDDSKVWFGVNFRLLDGSHNLLQFLSAKQVSAVYPNTAYAMSFKYELVGFEPLFEHAKEMFPDDYKRWENTQFRDAEAVGVLVYLKQLVPDLGLNIPSYDNNSPQYAIGDLLALGDTENYRGNDSTVKILNSDGVSHYTLALGLIYRFHIVQDPILNSYFENLIYSSWSGEPDQELRTMQIELWLGIPYYLPGSVPPATGSGPSGSGGSTPPSGSGGAPRQGGRRGTSSGGNSTNGGSGGGQPSSPNSPNPIGQTTMEALRNIGTAALDVGKSAATIAAETYIAKQFGAPPSAAPLIALGINALANSVNNNVSTQPLLTQGSAQPQLYLGDGQTHG